MASPIIQLMLSENENWLKTSQRHPERTPSEVTILRLDESILQTEEHDVDEILKNKYNEQERKHIIVDRSKGKIIDSRVVNVDQTFNKSECKPLRMTKAYTNNPLKEESEYIIERLIDDSTHQNKLKEAEEIEKRQSQAWKKEKGSILASLWEDNWKDVDRLHQAFLSTIVQNQPMQFIKMLEKRNPATTIDVNYKYQSGWTPLHYASMSPSITIISRLINHPRIDVNALTDFGDTPLHIAVKANKLQNCLLLLNAGVCIDKKDNDLNTALHYAVQLGYQNVAEVLLDYGACYEVKNNNGMTPVDLASTRMSAIFPNNKQTNQQEVDRLYQHRSTHRAMVQRMLYQNPSVMVPSNSNLQKKQKKQGKDKIVSNRKKNIYKMYQFIKEHQKVETITLSNFKFYKRIGEGAFGEVYLVKKDGKDKYMALKAIRKERVFGTNLYRYIQTEKEILSLLNHPFIVKLRYAFQTQTYLFLVMDFCEGGDLSKLLQKRKKFQQKYVRNYACEILLGIEALHKNNILYRDLKPENIVLDKDGHALITDFGLSKKTENLDDINRSFCGTPAYLPLEIINKKGHNRMADWYQFGVVLYELYTGFPPFYADTKAELYDLVRAGVIRFPKNTPEVFRDFIKKLLCQNPEKRLGFERDADSIKEHPWLADVDWQDVLERKLQMPPIENRIKIGQPIKTKFHDVKSDKYQIPMWSFVT